MCPYCHSQIIVKDGSRGAIKRFHCRDCNKTFTVFTNTIMEKTKLSWDVWVNILKMILANESLDNMTSILTDGFSLYGLDRRTVSTIRHKLLHAMASMPMPKLTGVIQIDETYFRESQKGTRELVSTIPGEERKPRKGRQPSKYGVMGNEFANVICMLDSTGRAVAKLVGLGKVDIETFVNEFDEYIDNPTFICADGNKVYQEYSKLKSYLY